MADAPGNAGQAMPKLAPSGSIRSVASNADFSALLAELPHQPSSFSGCSTSAHRVASTSERFLESNASSHAPKGVITRSIFRELYPQSSAFSSMQESHDVSGFEPSKNSVSSCNKSCTRVRLLVSKPPSSCRIRKTSW